MADAIDIRIKSVFDATGAAAARVAVGQVGDAASKAERDLLAYARTVATAQKAQGDHAGAAATLRSALGQVDQTSRQAQAGIGQLARVTQQGATASASYAAQLGGAVKSQLLGIVGPAALVTAGIGALHAGFQAGEAALSLKETENTLKALSGSTEQYNSIVATARQQQVLFGGSLEENIRGLQGLVVTSRSTGASLETLINLGQRLAILDPQQGAEGARIALSEVLSGDPRSLSRRYEIPLSALEKIKDESLPVAERLGILDQYLNKIGVTSSVMADRVDENAETFRLLAQKIGDAKNALGTFLAVSTATVVRIIIDPGKQTRETQGTAGDIAKEAKNYQDYVNQVNQSNAQVQVIDPMSGATDAGMVSTLTEAQFNYSRALQATGVSSQDATVKAFALSDADARRAQGLVELNALDGRREAILNLRASQTDLLIQKSTQLGGAMDQERQQAAQLQVATGLAATDIQRSAEASQLDAAQKDLQQQKTALLQAQTQATVDAFLKLKPGIDASAAASLAAAQGYGPQIGQLAAIAIEADHARFELNRMNLEKNLAVGTGAGTFRNGVVARSIGGGPTIGSALGGAGARDTSGGVLQEFDRIRASENQLALARAKSHQERIAILQRELGQTTDIATKNGILAQIAGEQQAIEKEKEAGAKRHTSELTKQLNLNERIYDSANKQRKAELDAAANIIRDRQQRRDEDAQLRTADRIAQRLGGRTDARALDFLGRAQDRSDLIAIQREQRQLDINEKQATAGAQVINGRLYQSRAGAPVGTPSPVGASAGAPVSTAAPSGGAAQGQQIIYFQLVDGGTPLAKTIEPYIMGQLLRAGQTQSARIGA